MTKNSSNSVVVYYSLSGHTRRLADRIGVLLGADVFEIKADRYTWPIAGYMRAGFDSLRGARPKLQQPLPDLRGYDLVAIGGPVWTSYPATPLRSYLANLENLHCRVGLFLTNGDHSPPEDAWTLAEADFGQAFDTKLAISNATEATADAHERIDQFAQTLIAGLHTADRMRLV